MLHRRNLCYGQGWRVGNRSYEARKRHENHGDCGSPWIAALGQHARGEPSRSAFGAAMFRLLHDRSQAGKLDRRSRLRQRSARCGAAKGRHRDDRAASGQPKQAAHARSTKVKPLHATLARRALLRLDSMAAPDPHSLGVPRPQFPRLCPACLPRYPLQTILRQVLVFSGEICMEWDDYLRQQAATYRQLAEKAEDAVVKKELLDLADVCEEVANNIEDRLTSG